MMRHYYGGDGEAMEGIGRIVRAWLDVRKRRR
jgi:hypothetical protein